MNDPMTGKLSAYIDGELSVDERAELDMHLETCDECRGTIDELRDVVVAASALRATEPGSDLWPAIAERIGGRTVPVGDSGVAGRITPRRFSLTLPQLAAAAVVLMTLSGGVVWMLDHQTADAGAGTQVAAGTIVHTAGGEAPPSTRLVESVAPDQDAYESDVAELERALEENRGSLDPATVEVVERSIELIDAAIGDARDALESDPGNPQLHRQLDSTMRKKLDVLRRATRGAS